MSWSNGWSQSSQAELPPSVWGWRKKLVMSTSFSGYLVYDEYFTSVPPPNPMMTLRVAPIIILTLHSGTKKLNYLPTVTWVTSGPKSNHMLSKDHAPLHFLVCWSLMRSPRRTLRILESFQRKCSFDYNRANFQPQKEHKKYAVFQVTHSTSCSWWAPRGHLTQGQLILQLPMNMLWLAPKYDQFEFFPYKVEFENTKGICSYP